MEFLEYMQYTGGASDLTAGEALRDLAYFRSLSPDKHEVAALLLRESLFTSRRVIVSSANPIRKAALNHTMGYPVDFAM